MNRREFVVLAAAAPVTLRAAIMAPQPTALVPSDEEARIAVVDLGSFMVARSLPTLPDPRSVELVGKHAVVCHTAVGAVSVVGPRGVAHVVRGFVEPRYVAAHPDGRHAFVSDSGRSGVVLVDVLRGRALGRVRLPGWARHLTIDPSGNHLWVGLGSASEHVAVVDTRRLRHTTTLSPAFPMHDVVHAPDGRLWLTAGGQGRIAVGSVEHSADRAPQHVTFSRAAAYVTSGAQGTVRVLDLDGSIRRTTPVPVGSYNVQYGFGRVVTGSLGGGTLTVLDGRGALLAHVRVASSCHDACLAAW